MAQSPGAKLRETVQGVVSIGAAVSAQSQKLKDEASVRAQSVIDQGVSGGGNSGQSQGS